MRFAASNDGTELNDVAPRLSSSELVGLAEGNGRSGTRGGKFREVATPGWNV